VAKVTGLVAGAEATGVAADLLQISPEERSRAARSAALFTEEELSRFLAIVLRTFDELGYRQEQRFHLELGLLKLVHVQRLVPIEELLSQLGAKPAGTVKTVATAMSAGSLGAGRAAAVAAPVAAAVASPFEVDRGRKTPAASSGQTAEMRTATDGALALAAEAVVTEVPVERPHLVPNVVAPVALGAIDVGELQGKMVAALGSVKGQQSASEQMEEATLTVEGETVSVQTGLSKTMLPVVMNAEAEKILKGVLREVNAALKLVLLPGVAAEAGVVKRPPRAASAGSAAELAEKHPVVQEARRLFSAEISNVIDLRDKD
jgi:DNA polymerase-3 subunit gamma/tau